MGWIWAAIFGALGLVFAVLAILQFCERGFVLHNTYIFASPQERGTMNKSPLYRHSAVVLALCAVLFFAMGAECLLLTGWLWLAVGAAAVAILVCAIAWKD